MKISELEARIKELERVNKELKEVIRTIEKAHANDTELFKHELSNKLETEFVDFYDSINDEMDILLGEIYRVKIDNIAYILRKNGINIPQ